MAVVEKDYKGGTETLNLNGTLSSGAATLTVKTTPSGNWPTGSTLPFVITVDRGNAAEEIMLCSARAGANITISNRGYAGSAPVSHGDNATVEHTIDAIALADFMHAAAQTTGKVTTAEDILVATASGAFKRVAKGADGNVLRVAGGAVGWGVIPDGSISSSTMFGTGVVGATQLAANSVVAGKVAAGGVSAANQVASGILTDTQVASANKDGAAGTASLRTLGPGASQAAAGTDSRFGDIAPIGAIMLWAMAAAPTRWLLLDGSNQSRATFAALFALWGTNFGAGDGSTTFGIPDCRGRVMVGLDNMGTPAGAAGRVAGATMNGSGGSATQTLATTDLPPHTHAIDHDHPSSSTTTDGAHAHNMNTGFVQSGIGATGANGGVFNVATDVQGAHAHTFDVPAFTGASGNGPGTSGGHNNLQPYLGLNVIVKAL